MRRGCPAMLVNVFQCFSMLNHAFSILFHDSNRFATPGGRRGLQACGLWMRSVFFCTHDRADAKHQRKDCFRPCRYCRPCRCYRHYSFLLYRFFVGCGGRRHAHNINATPVIFSFQWRMNLKKLSKTLQATVPILLTVPMLPTVRMSFFASQREPLSDIVFGEYFGTIVNLFWVHFGIHFVPKAMKIISNSTLKKNRDKSL